MHRLTLWAAVAALTAAGASVPARAGAPAPGRAAIGHDASAPAQAPTAGRDVFRVRCAPCHGAAGHGDGPAAAAMNPHPVNFANKAVRLAKTDSAVADVIRHGRRQMPAFAAILRPAQVDSVAAYVKTLSH